MSSFDNVSKNFVDGTDCHIGEFVKTDGVLTLCQVRSSQEDVNGLDGSHDAMLKIDHQEHAHLYIVINVDIVWSG